MRVLRGEPGEWAIEARPRAMTIGVYDGVHLGHRHVLEVLRELAGERSLAEVGVVTFDPHPLRVVAPERAPLMLTTVEQRLELLADLGIDLTAVIRFDDAMRRRTPASFVGEVLGGVLGARLVAVGEDFRFGRDRTGNVASLHELGDVHGFETRVVPLVGAERPVSSTAIRAMITGGDVVQAAAALARPHEVPGTVIPGDGRGRSIGFPTANLDVPEDLVIPAGGVYAVRAAPPGEPFVDGVANIGVRPTFGGTRQLVEVHLLDTDRDLYGRRLRVRFVDRIRDERRFESVELLVAQIRRDVDAARELLAG